MTKLCHAQHQPAGRRIDECRLEPGTILREQFFGESREELHGVEERPLLLDHRVNRDVLECDGCHRDASLGLIKIRRMLVQYSVETGCTLLSGFVAI
jgi:hypothetical protein